MTPSRFKNSDLFFPQARGGIEQDVLEAYCWMYSTWNIPKEYKGACSGGDQVRTIAQKDFLNIFDRFTIHALRNFRWMIFVPIIRKWICQYFL